MQYLAMSNIRGGFVGLVGKTPLVRLNKISNETGCEVLAKAEFANPGGSVKDRPAMFLIRDAEEKGLLKPGGFIVEGTSGNTGIGMAHICLTLGYKCVVFMPDGNSQEKVRLLKTLGVDVRQVPKVPHDDPANYNQQARKFAEETPNTVWMNQFNSIINRQAHYKTTGPEIWEETGGKVDAVVFSAGTGGTIAGVGMFLKEKNPSIKVVVADCQGSMLYNYVKHGKMEKTPGETITEGIGKTWITGNLEGAPMDDAIAVSDADAINMTFELLHEEGLFVGSSSGLNVFAAKQLAETMGPGHTIVTALCDTGQKYMAKVYNRQFLESKGLLEAVPEKYRASLQ